MTSSPEQQPQQTIAIDCADVPSLQGPRPEVWVQNVEIPTYTVGGPTPHPMYLQDRVYQGSSGKVYPLPLIESVGDTTVPKVYKAVFLENRYVKLMVLPELGGRIHMAYDKTREYHFVYFNRVIKPALVGLAGPWIAGGIEFNWPQHHRPSTFSSVEYQTELQDHSATVYLSEIDRMYGLRVTTAVSLHEEDVRIHIATEVSNRTLYGQTFLWWANPAVPANEEYQAVFPPDVRAVFDHGKRDVSRFPIATGTYYKVDYAHGVDISWYKNIPVPTSYMAHYSRFNFVGGYDHGRKSGLLHNAENGISPGKKLWTWGNGDFARAWERNLTDEDGPYIELMTGVYSENQPDFTWIAPGETRSFTQHFYPYSDMPRVLCANAHAAINIDVSNGEPILAVYATHAQTLRPIVTGRSATFKLEARELKPHSVTYWTLPEWTEACDSEESIKLIDTDGRVVLSFRNSETEGAPIPDPASAPPAPEAGTSAEELYLIGIHLEQYRHATFNPDSYYEEAIRRDPGHSRAHTAMARRLLYRDRPLEALEHAQKAITRVTRWNDNPESGWPHYYLGLSNTRIARYRDAEQAFCKSAWSDDSRAAALYELASLEMRSGHFDDALIHLDECLQVRPESERAADLRLTALRKNGNKLEFNRAHAELCSINPLSYFAACEQWLGEHAESGDNDQTAWSSLWNDALGGSIERLVDVLCEYAHAGGNEEIIRLVTAYRLSEGPSLHPIPLYFAAAAAESGWSREDSIVKMDIHPDTTSNVPDRAIDWLEEAENLPSGAVFPVRHEELDALEHAVSHGSNCPMAHYYLGNAHYDRGNHDTAYRHWVQATERKTNFASAHRNMAVYLHNNARQTDKAIEAMEVAFSTAPNDSRLLLELDDLYRRDGRPLSERKRLLEARPDLISEREDLAVRFAGILTSVGEPGKAHKALSERRFHPWEGGEGVVPGEYRRSLIRCGLESLCNSDFDSALRSFRAAKEYPENLGEGKLPITPDNEPDYWIGVSLASKGETDLAAASFKSASQGNHEPSLSLYYNDTPARAILYQGLAWRALDNEVEARRRFFALRDYGERHETESLEPDYFAVSFPELVVFKYDLAGKHRLFTRLVKALGYLGLGELSEARIQLDQILQSDPGDPDANDHAHLIGSTQLRRFMHIPSQIKVSGEV